MKHSANIITSLRIVLSFGLLLATPLSPFFLLLYALCGVTDVLDGYIARKLQITSKFGSRLDSIADVCFIVIVCIRLIPVVSLSRLLVIWMIVIAIIRFLSIFIGLYKYHTLAMLHTYANKATGLLLFFVPLLLPFIDLDIVAIGVCLVAGFSAIEELLIQLRSKTLNTDIRGLFDGSKKG